MRKENSRPMAHANIPDVSSADMQTSPWTYVDTPLRDKQRNDLLFAFTVNEFCRAHRISRSLFYELLRTGRGPVVMHVGKRTLVSVEASAAWRSQMESQPSLRQLTTTEKERNTHTPSRLKNKRTKSKK